MSSRPAFPVSVAVLVLLAIVASGGCQYLEPAGSGPTAASAAEFQTLLKSGDQLCQEFDALTARREWSEMTQRYELLRLNYIDAAERLNSQPKLATAPALATLARWEQVIARYRLAWKAVNEVPQIEGGELSDQMKQLLEKGAAARAQKESEWAPVEKQLDEALASVEKLRSK